MDRKWSSTTSDPQSQVKWSGKNKVKGMNFMGLITKIRTDYKKEPFSPDF